MLTTQTITIPMDRPTQRIINLVSVEENYREALFGLSEILQTYAWEDDSLSLRLRDWGLQWFILIPEDGSITEEEAMAKAKQQFHALKRILANPLDPQNSLVKDPLFDPEGGWVWEKRDYRNYTQISPSGLCPFTGYPFTALPHPFAKALLAWVNNLPTLGFSSYEEMTAENTVSTTHQIGTLSLNPTSGNGRLTNTSSRATSIYSSNRSIQLGSALETNQIPVLQLIAYKALAKEAVTLRELQLTQDVAASIASEAESGLVGMRETLQQEAERARQYAMQQREMLEERISGLENDYTQAAGMLENSIAGLQAQLSQGLENAHQNRETIEALEAQLAQDILERTNLQERHQQQLDELLVIRERERAQNIAAQEVLRQGHQQQVDRVIDENTNMRQQQQRQLDHRLTTIERNNRDAQNMLNTQIGSIQKEKACVQKRVQDLSVTLATQEAVIKRQQQKQGQLEQQIKDQASQIAHLSKESGGGGSSCVIL